MRRSLPVSLLLALLLLVSLPALPVAADTNYTVQPGDTLWSIASEHDETVETVVAANDITNPDYIFSGQVLTIPTTGGSAPASAPSAPPAAQPAPATPDPRNVSAGPGSILAKRMVVSYYGNPYSGLMGVLGQLSKDELVAALKRRAAQYEAASGRPVQPAIHFIATVAQASAGSDGMYRARMPLEVAQEYAQLAANNDMLFILDIQFGRSTAQAEIPPWLPLLKEPHVHLAIDPEFDMWGSEQPGADLGHMMAYEVNYASDYLSNLVAQYNLPNKMLIVHQFTASMLPDKQNIQTNPNVDLVIDMDGFGYSSLKIQHYDWYVRDQAPQFAGIKLFLEHDPDLMTAADVMGLTPPPDLVIYQ